MNRIERTVPTECDNMRALYALKHMCPMLPMAALYKAFRNKDVKADGRRIKRDEKVSVGWHITVYGVSDLSDRQQSELIWYENDDFLVVNKPQGLPVHPGRTKSGETTLIEQLQKIKKIPLYLCHRLDRNTGGLLLVAMNQKVLKAIVRGMKLGTVKKEYQAWVFGIPNAPYGRLEAWLVKNAKNHHVHVDDVKSKGASRVVTSYRIERTVCHRDHMLSLLSIGLETGRTHQIRAHLSHIGHPIAGDGKYGDARLNKKVGIGVQQLFATGIIFENFVFELDGRCEALDRTFRIRPEYRWGK